MKRREFLKRGTIIAVGAAAAASGVSVTGYAATEAVKLAALDQHDGATLLQMARQIFPHERLDDSYYIKVVEDLDVEASGKPATAKMLSAGVANLDRSAKGKFAAEPAQEQTAALEKIQHTPFFEKVRSVELVSLYNNQGVWKVFGYQGASYPFGGYLHHGFNDLSWLPDPPEAASPKPG